MEPPLPQPAGTLLDDIRACHGGLTVPGVWREFEHGWPVLAAPAWVEIRRLALAPRFGGGRHELIEYAAEAIAPGTIPPPEELIPDAEAAREVERIVAWFARAIPTMVVEIECMRRAFTAGTGAEMEASIRRVAIVGSGPHGRPDGPQADGRGLRGGGVGRRARACGGSVRRGRRTRRGPRGRGRRGRCDDHEPSHPGDRRGRAHRASAACWRAPPPAMWCSR